MGEEQKADFWRICTLSASDAGIHALDLWMRCGASEDNGVGARLVSELKWIVHYSRLFGKSRLCAGIERFLTVSGHALVPRALYLGKVWKAMPSPASAKRRR
jgi:hypothetical protein